MTPSPSEPIALDNPMALDPSLLLMTIGSHDTIVSSLFTHNFQIK